MVRQTDKLLDDQTDRQMIGWSDRRTDRQILEGKTDRQMIRWSDRQTDRQMIRW